MKIKKLFLLINILLTGLILWMATHMIMGWASGKPEIDKPRGGGSIEKSLEKGFPQREKDIEYYQVIIDQDVFKTKKAPLKPQMTGQEEVKITELDLTLRGTVVGENQDSYAIIVDGSSNKEDLYYLNNFIQGVRIARIMSDRVILDKDGNEEALLLSYEAPSARRRAAVRKRRTSRRSTRRDLVRRRARTPRPSRR
jgi:type II secretory pathway component PulC